MGYFNPLLKLPAAKAILALGATQRSVLRMLLMDLRKHANDEADRCWRSRKGGLAAYWRTVATYTRHVAHALNQPATPEELRSEFALMAERLAVANGQLADFVEAARAAIPADEHPKEGTYHNWAWQIRVLGEDRRAVYKHLARAEERLTLEATA